MITRLKNLSLRQKLSLALSGVLLVVLLVTIGLRIKSPKADIVATSTEPTIQLINGKLSFKNGRSPDGFTVMIGSKGMHVPIDGSYEIITTETGELPVQFFSRGDKFSYQIADAAEQSIWIEPNDNKTIDFVIEQATAAPVVQCNDNQDNDGDTKIDWPDDPGCATLDGDNDEADPAATPSPTPAGIPTLANVYAAKSLNTWLRTLSVTITWYNPWIDNTPYSKEIEIQRSTNSLDPASFTTITKVAFGQTSYIDRPPYSTTAIYYYRLRNCKIVLSQSQCSAYTPAIQAR